MGLLLTGITYEEARRKWLARAGTGEDRYHVGRYETEEEAAAALRAEQERTQRAELEDPIDHMCKLATSPGANRAADNASRTSASSASQGLSSAGALLVDVEVLSMIYSAPQLIMSGAALIDGSAALRGAQRVSSNE